jgi:anhydro-N-acetylmuramic acid kinase
MIVAGVMSGTSADGIDVALVRITGGGSSARNSRRSGHSREALRLKLLGHAAFPYPRKVREAVLNAMNARAASVADLARLNHVLGELYARAILETQKRLRRKAELVGCHGQTIYHQGALLPYLGHTLAVTWQTGEAAVIAGRIGVPVVSDFRPADMAAGGHGAPLVPFLDAMFYAHPRIGRIAQNIGGIANLTAIPPGGNPARLRAFDTGPGNMVIDALAEKLFHRPYDRDGRLAAQGIVLEPAVKEFLELRFFRERPPKTAGREEFGREFVARFLQRCGRARKEDLMATATAFTARSIALSIERFVRPRAAYRELIVSGGGARNPTLLAMLANTVQPLGLQLRLSDEFGLPSEAKEAVAFALLAYQTWHRQPSNIPSATGARRPAILGKISYA